MTRGRGASSLALAFVLPVLAFAAWEAASATGLLRPVFFPRPSVLAGHGAAMLMDGSLLGHARVTVTRLVWAFVLAALPGVAAGLAMGMSRRVREGLDPLFAAIFPVPSVLFLPLLMFALPAEELARVVTAAVTSFFLIAYTTMTGVQQIEPLVLDAARHFGARGRRLFLAVLLPGTLPFILTGLRLGLGYALIVVIVVEMIGAQHGLGGLLWLSWQLLRVDDMYVALGAIAVLGAALTWGLETLRRRLLPWAQDIAEVGA